MQYVQYTYYTCTHTSCTFSSDLRSDLWVGFRLSTVNMYTARRAIEFLCEYRTVYLKLCLNFFLIIFFLHKQRSRHRSIRQWRPVRSEGYTLLNVSRCWLKNKMLFQVSAAEHSNHIICFFIYFRTQQQYNNNLHYTMRV